MRLRVLSVGAVLVSLSVGCGADVVAQEIRSVIEEIAELHADAVGILEEILDETDQAVSEWPEDPQAQFDADRAARRLAQAAEQHAALLEKLEEVLADDEWDRAFPLEALAGGDGRPIAIVRVLRARAEAEVDVARRQLETARQRAETAESQRVEAAAAAVAAEERTAAAEVRAAATEAAAPARRAALAERLDAVELVYESIFATHEQAAEVLTDVFEQRWARDRIPSDRTRMESIVSPARAAVEGAGVGDLDRVERRVEAAEADAQQMLAQAEAELNAAREKVR